MPLIDSKPHKFILFSKNDIKPDITGGWSIVNKNTDKSLAKIPLMNNDNIDFFKDFIRKDSYGNIVFCISTTANQIDKQFITVKSNKLIDFKNLSLLRFTFVRDNILLYTKKFKPNITIRLIDRFNRINKVWNGGGKNCWYERGEIDISDVTKECYIEISAAIELSTGLALLNTKNNEDMYTKDNKELWAPYKYINLFDNRIGSAYFEIKELWAE